MENSGEMIGWELRELMLRLRVTRNNNFKKFTDAKSRIIQQRSLAKEEVTEIAQISPGRGLRED